MNFLAHLYLSGASQQIRIGNFIGDYVKGKQYTDYPSDIQRGILLHRNIDYYTDKHPLVSQSSQRLRKSYNRYSGIVVDVMYDHFLAKNWPDYHFLSLSDYTKEVHNILLRNYLILPMKVKQFLPFMIQSKRLESYATLEGIEHALQIMSRRTSLPNCTPQAMECIGEYYSDFENEFTLFFADAIKYIQTKHNIILEAPNGLRQDAGK